MKQNGTQTNNPELNIVEDTTEAQATDYAHELFDLLPKLQTLMAAVEHHHQNPANNDVLLGVKDLLLELHGDLARIAGKLEENQ